MTDEPERDPRQEYLRDDHVDPFLATLVEGANAGTELGLTISCGGQLISGTLTGGRRYFEGFDKTFIEGARKSGAAVPDEVFAPLGASYPDPDEPETEGTIEKRPVRYIHLRNARIWHGIGQPISCGLWRAKLSAVDGFFLGDLNLPG